MAEDRMLSDEVLLALINKNSGGGGGGGGTNNYNDLSNQPQINGNTLIGNKTASDLGLVAAEAGKGLSSNDYTNEDKAIVGGVTAALADKQNELTAGSHITIDNDEISVQRWAVPAGKVVYTVITSDENYGQNVHVQRHTLGGTFIDDRVYFVQTWQTATVDDVISIKDTYGKFEITLLKNSDEQSAGYKYIVQPVTTPTSNSFTFLMEQEENGNDLIIRSELDTKQDKLTFDDTPTDNSNNPVKSNGIYDALALKQDKTDNSLQTTDKTVVGAVNELKSGLTNYENQNDRNLEVPNRKNLFDPNSKLQLGFSNSIGTGGTFTSGSYYAYVVTKRSVPTFTISGVDYTKMEDASIRVFVSSSYPAVGVAQWRTSNISDLSSKTVTLSENDKYLVFLIKWEDTATQADKEAIMVEEGYTATTFAPYIPSVDARLDAVKSGLINYQAQNDLNLEVPNRRNLWDGNYTDIAAQTVTYKPIKVADGNYTISTTCPQNSLNGANIFLLSGNVQEGATTSGNGVWEGHTKTVASANGYITIAYKLDGGVDPRNYDTQIEYGSTATAYTPYIPSVDARLDAVESGLTNFVDNNKAIKANSTAWPSDSLVFHIMPKNDTMYHLVVSYSNNDDSFFEAYYVIRSDSGLTTKYCSNGLTLAYDNTTNNLTVTMSSGQGYYVYRNSIVATKEG